MKALFLSIFCLLVLAESKTCLFLHGSGRPEQSAPTTTFTDYWGKVHEKVPQCNQTIFSHHDTVTKTWTDEYNLRAICALATNARLGIDWLTAEYQKNNVTKVYDELIKDTIVFTHSMGNLVLAAAISKGYCDIDMATSSWYSISGPMLGTRACDRADGVCQNANSTIESVLRPLVKLLHFCQNVSGVEHTTDVYRSMRTDNPELQTLHVVDILRNRIKGAMCGDSAFGILSVVSFPLKALAELTDFGEPNDGMVSFSSCAVVAPVGVSPTLLSTDPEIAMQKWKELHAVEAFNFFEPDFRRPFYRGPLNHADTTCRSGDAIIPPVTDNVRPCSWFSYRL